MMEKLFVKPNKVQNALSEYLDSSNSGDLVAMTYLAECYEDGLGGLCIDEEKAFDLYSMAAKRGYAPAQYNLFCWYNDEEFDLYNPSIARKWLEKAAEQEYAPALTHIASIYLQEGNFEEAFVSLVKAIDGFGERDFAYRELFCHFRIGHFSYISNEDAFEYAKLSGSSMESNLGYCYAHGIGVDVDVNKSIFYYSIAANKEDNDNDWFDFDQAEAQYQLAELYFKIEDYHNALNWYRVSADNGYVLAQVELGEAYLFGYDPEGGTLLHVNADINKAKKYLELAAEQGDEMACNYIERIKNREF